MTQANPPQLTQTTMRLALRIRENSPKPLSLRQSIRRALWVQEEGRAIYEALQQQRQQPNE